MTLNEIRIKSGVSLAKLRKLQALGVLKADPGNDPADAIRTHLHRNATLSVNHLMTLLDEPDIAFRLGVYEPRVTAQIEALGEVGTTYVPPRAVVHAVVPASRGDAAALETLADWVRGVAPCDPVRYHWFAVRLLAAQFPQFRDEMARALNLAFAKLRALPLMLGYWKKSDRGEIFYAQPIDGAAW